MNDTAAIATRKHKPLAIFFAAYLAGVWAYPPLGWMIPACMAGGMVLASLHGRRLWCARYCPRGNFLSFFGLYISFKNPPPRFMSAPAFRWGLAAALMGLAASRTVMLWPDYLAVARFFAIMLSVTTAAAALLAAFYAPRTWCGVCPVGTIADAGRRR